MSAAERLDANNQFICLEHGTHTKVDEDGCCATCGRDCLVIENGELHGAAFMLEAYDAYTDADDEDPIDEGDTKVPS